jgi:D-sedoheptulose 7-phosphate isomerase
MRLKERAESYYSNLSNMLMKMQTTQKNGYSLEFFAAIESAGQLVTSQTKAGGKIMFIGNGASASIASHMSTDYWKNGDMRAIAFNDAALLTCLSNDCGYENVFGKSVEMFADEGDILIAISSSGQSESILNGVRAATKLGVHVVTLSGFSPDNPLRSMGEINFYVPDSAYGPVEILHLSVCHCILDVVIMDRLNDTVGSI